MLYSVLLPNGFVTGTMTEYLLKSLNFLCTIYYNNKVFSGSNVLEDKFLLQADYSHPDEASFNLDPDGPSTAPILPIADLAATAVNDGGKRE